MSFYNCQNHRIYNTNSELYRKYGPWVMICQCGFIDINKGITMVWGF